jgi:putative heme iron utilization protein
MGMRAVKIAVAVMSVLIVLGIAVLVVTMIDRLSAPAAPRIAATAAAVMDEPAGTAIAGIAAIGDRLAVQLHGGPDRVVFVDSHTATVAGRISLTK